MITNGRYCSCVYDDREKLASRCPWCILDSKNKKLKQENKELKEKLEKAVSCLVFYSQFDCNVLCNSDEKRELIGVLAEYWTKDRGEAARQTLKELGE